MDTSSIIIMTLVVFGLVGFYAIGLYFNKKTPLPEECELPSLKCEHCTSVTCSYSEKNRVSIIKKDIKESLKNNKSREGALNE